MYMHRERNNRDRDKKCKSGQVQTQQDAHEMQAGECARKDVRFLSKEELDAHQSSRFLQVLHSTLSFEQLR